MQTRNRNRIRRTALKPALAIGTIVVAMVAAIVAVPAFAASVPTVTGTTPGSPANDNIPQVTGTADSGSTVDLYTTSDCSGSPIASGTETLFSTGGIRVNVQDDTSTTFYATATDGNGTSACSSTSATYVEDSTAPAMPTVDSTDPDSPANENDPKVKGTAEAGSNVILYTTDDCTGTAAASGSASAFSSTGIAAHVGNDSTTTFYATATDAAGNVSPCSTTSVEFVEDSHADPPTVIATSPASPANDNDPELTGTSESGSTINVYTTNDCSGTAIATGPESAFSSTGITAHVADDTTTTFYATATDSAGNVSICSTTSVTYVEDSTAPEPPDLAATNPVGPANDNNPEIVGQAELGSTVNIFLTPDCSGSPLVSGTESDFALSGLTVPVANDSVTVIYATATDAAGNQSVCTVDPVTYYEDSTAPDTRVTFAPAGKSRDRTPTFLFTVLGDEPTVTFVCQLDGGPAKPCKSPKTYGKLSLRHHEFRVRAVDEAGNMDPSAASRGFRLVRRPRH